MCANCNFCENIAWEFGVNWVFGAFLIYPIYPKNPKYYFFVFSSLLKQQFRITNSFSFDYADSPYHLITSSPPSYGLPADTFSALLKSPQKFISITFLPENQCSILNYAEWHYLHFVHFGHFRKFLKCTKCTKGHMFFYIFPHECDF